MYGFYAQGSENMVCHHIADWSRQVLGYLDGLRERGVSSERIGGWREQFETLEAEANSLLNPWHWGMQGMGAVAKLLERAHEALRDFTPMHQDLTGSPGSKQAPEEDSGEAAPPEPDAELARSDGGWERRPMERAPFGRVELRPVPIGEHRLPPLPYPYDALEPHIDEQTMRLHHDKHHQSYVDGLNKAERMMAEARRSGDFDLIKHWEREAAFHGAGHYLHTLFWNIMAPNAGGMPTGAVADQIQRDFGSFEQFQQQFSRAAEKVEGSGWALWVWSPRANRTEILTAEKHQNLSQWEAIPLLVLDVWEHSYYLKHQDNRKAYIDAWWNVVNWPEVARRFQQARTLAWEPF